ncbi:DUF2523 family protein [Pseudomonas sp. LRF_L74]|uniref:DUF2523 family protein n=1 Tax=Pseudomonas sp. LRF_L74 TaxID=3369422 RepID=UPI003F62C76B
MDLGFVGDFFNGINDAVGDFLEFTKNGIYQFFKEVFVVFTKVMIYSYLKTMVFALDVAYTVVQDIMEDIGVADQVSQFYGAIPDEYRSMLGFFKVPQAITMIFSAIPTRWALKFVPFIGR